MITDAFHVITTSLFANQSFTFRAVYEEVTDRFDYRFYFLSGNHCDWLPRLALDADKMRSDGWLDGVGCLTNRAVLKRFEVHDPSFL